MPDFDVMLRGYDQREVDELFGRIEAALGRTTEIQETRITADGVRRTNFTMVMRGYDPTAVDHELTRCVGELERRERDSSGQWRILRSAT